jgi:hypothetical protein
MSRPVLVCAILEVQLAQSALECMTTQRALVVGGSGFLGTLLQQMIALL